MREAEQTSLYKFYDKKERLLYVGISFNVMIRVYNHFQNGRSNGVRKILIDHFKSRKKAMMAERIAIRTEHPRWNFQYQIKKLKRSFSRPTVIQLDESKLVKLSELTFKGRYTQNERRLIAIVLEAGKITSSDIVDRHYQGRIKPSQAQRSVAVVLNNILFKSLNFNEDWVLYKSERTGPIPIYWGIINK